MIFAAVLGFLGAVALTVILCIKVLPAKFDGKFSKKSLQTVHDYFNFKKLYLESILKILFTFMSLFSFVGGIFVAIFGTAIQFIQSIIRVIDYGYFGTWVFTQALATFFGGILVAVIAPIALRLAYEGIMMFILLVKNVIDINNKMNSSDKEINE